MGFVNFVVGSEIVWRMPVRSGRVGNLAKVGWQIGERLENELGLSARQLRHDFDVVF